MADAILIHGFCGSRFATVSQPGSVKCGGVALDAPVACYWSEVAHADKGAIRVRTLLGHCSWLPAIRRALPQPATYDWKQMTSALEQGAPALGAGSDAQLSREDVWVPGRRDRAPAQWRGDRRVREPRDRAEARRRCPRQEATQAHEASPG